MSAVGIKFVCSWSIVGVKLDRFVGIKLVELVAIVGKLMSLVELGEVGKSVG